MVRTENPKESKPLVLGNQVIILNYMYCREQKILVVNIISKFGWIVTNEKNFPA
jgi:hypothetical protein